MARGLKRSLIQGSAPQGGAEGDDTAKQADAPKAFQRAAGGAGSAWKAGAVAQAQAGLDEARDTLSKDILAGRHVLEIDPAAIKDPIGTDRRDDWAAREEFLALKNSVEANGQDTPIQVWPADPNWVPDALDPTNLEHVQFLLLAGRRRCEVAQQLGRTVRAVIAPQGDRNTAHEAFGMLVMRFRENEAREDLSAFERLISIGQMYDALVAASETKVTAKGFADQIGVHESVVSRARAVLKAKDPLLNAFKNVYDFSFQELQKAMAALNEKPAAPKAKPTRLRSTHKVGSRNLVVETVSGKLAVKASGLALDQTQVNELGEIIATYLNNNRSS